MQLTKNFTDDEFNCPCCGEGYVDYPFLLKLQQAREIANAPFHINSGWRCEKHNKEVGGVENSSHLNGTAADIKVSGPRSRWRIVSSLIHAGFTRIGIKETFIHVDSDSKIFGMIWL